jgi:hypothetical protein
MARLAGHPKIAVLGDSVPWGQGLVDGHKYAFQVAKAFNTPKTDLYLKAHSGAVIGAGYTGNQTNVDSEIPFGTPTIRSQVDDVPDPSTIDLVLLSGGMNDVSIWTILNPTTTKDNLQRLTFKACYRDMKSLLSRVVSVFTKPSCRCAVSGYYPILSSESKLKSTKRVAEFDHLLGLYNHGYPRTINRELVLNHLCDLAMQFWHDSDKYLELAVSEIATAHDLGTRLLFVGSSFSEKNALFADVCWLFGFNPRDLSPQDEVRKCRAAACDAYYSTDLFARELCHYASVGHPNVTGAQKIAGTLLKALTPVPLHRHS